MYGLERLIMGKTFVLAEKPSVGKKNIARVLGVIRRTKAIMKGKTISYLGLWGI